MRHKPVPQPTPETQPFWNGTCAEQLWIQRCSGCTRHFFYPRSQSPYCASANVEWVKATGRATLYSYVINYRAAAPGVEDDGPYPIAVVQLEEGPRMMSTIVGAKPTPEALALDMPLEVVFERCGDINLPVFHPRRRQQGAQ